MVCNADYATKYRLHSIRHKRPYLSPHSAVKLWSAITSLPGEHSTFLLQASRYGLWSPNRALRQVIHFAGVRRFGEAQLLTRSGIEIDEHSRTPAALRGELAEAKSLLS
jgi:hypothetical protein